MVSSVSVFDTVKLRWGVFLVIAVSLLVSACGVTELYRHRHPALAMSGPESVTVHVLRPDAFVAKWVSLPVSLNGVQLLTMENSTYTTVYLQSGSYAVKVQYKHHSERPVKTASTTTTFEAGSAQIELVAGGTYYLLVTAAARSTSSFLVGRHVHFINKTGLLSQEDGEALRRELEFIEIMP